MATVTEAQMILQALGMPPAQCNAMSGMTLLALCRLNTSAPWSQAQRVECVITKGIMDYIREELGVDYAPNTRETFRRQVLHQFVQGRIAEHNPFDPSLPVNSPRSHYAVSEAALVAIQRYGTSDWQKAVEDFHYEHGSLAESYSSPRDFLMIPVRLPNGETVQLSPGDHNLLQRSIVEDFAPRFVPGAFLLYLGDTAGKDLFLDKDGLEQIGFIIDEHGKLPDLVFYHPERAALLLVEAVTSHGPVTPKRVTELREMMKDSPAQVVFVTAFLDFGEFRKHITEVAWDTDVWISEVPDHMIHYNGDRFLPPMHC